MKTVEIKTLVKHIARVIFVVENNESLGISLWDSYNKFIYANGYTAGSDRNSNYLSMHIDYIDETVYNSAKATLLFRECGDDLPDDIAEKVSGLFVIKRDNVIYAVNSNGGIIAKVDEEEKLFSLEKLFNTVCNKYGFLIDMYCEFTTLYNEDGYNECGTMIGDFTIYGNEGSAIKNSNLEAFYGWSKEILPHINDKGYSKFDGRITEYDVIKFAKEKGIELENVDMDCIDAAIVHFWDYTILNIPRFKTIAIGNRKGKFWFIIEQGDTYNIGHQDVYKAPSYVDLDELRAAQKWIQESYESVLNEVLFNC